MATPGLAPEATEQDRPRAVTDDEVAFFKENGWVKLEGLISPDTASRMQQWLEGKMGKDAEKGNAVASASKHALMWSKYNSPSNESELFDSFAKSSDMGRLGKSLIQRDIRFWADTALIKPPGRGEAGVTPWHQDTPNQPHDRKGLITVWMALNDIPPERGTMRFLSKSHHEGPLGKQFVEDMSVEHPYLLDDYEKSPELHLKAGDATVHAGYVLHAAPPNTTDEVRWVYSVSLIDAGTLYTGYPPNWVADGKGLEPGGVFDHENFPVLT